VKKLDAVLTYADDLWTVAQTVWGEARGDGEKGMIAVCWVIRNRYEVHPRWKEMALMTICRAPYQFSAWNAHDPNLEKMLSLSLVDVDFCHALHLVVDVLSGVTPSIVGKATHYYVRGTPVPTWAVGKTPCCLVGKQLFFEDIA
jgi:N-acetylmuramoyl-L-alanine amidase